MKLTSALYVRQFIAKLHPPLPKSPREAQKLLLLLQSSFKRQLDDIYPSPRAANAIDAISDAPQIAKSSSAEATNRHLESILGHPLLDHEAQSVTPRALSPPSAAAVFDKALLNNKADIRLIEICVNSYTRERNPVRGIEIAKSLGSRFATWFNSSESVAQATFLTDIKLMVKVVPMMYRGSHEQVVWEWLRTLYESNLQRVISGIGHSGSQYPPWLSVEDKFVALMMRESVRRNDLSGATQEFMQACEYRLDSIRSTVSFSDVSSWLRWPLTASWKTISYAILEKRFSHGIPDTMFRSLLHYIPRPVGPFIPRWAFLSIYRPSAAETSTLYTTLKDPKFLKLFLAWKTSGSQKLQKILLVSVLDAAELALNEGSAERSRFFLGFAEEHFATFITPHPTSDVATRIEYARQDLRAHAHEPAILGFS